MILYVQKYILTLFLCCTAILVQGQNIGEIKSSLTSEEKEYLLKFVYPLASFDPEYKNVGDFKILNKFIGDSKVVALGEVTHGSSEIFKMKDRIIRYLSQHNEFDIFSIEAAMPESYLMNAFINSGVGSPEAYLDKMYFWTWNVKEVADLVVWMKAYNDAHLNKIKFTGFDMQYFLGAIDELKKINAKNTIDNENIEKLKVILIDVKRKSKMAKTRFSSIDSLQKVELKLIFESTNQLSKKFSIEDKKWAKQNLRIIEQFLNKTANSRDMYMAENVLWIKDNNPNSKLILWAHNGHIKKTETSMGKYLADTLGEDYKTIGFTFYKGSYTAIGRETRLLGTFNAQDAYPGTLEYLLNSLEIPIFILDVKSIKKENNSLAEWLLKDLPYRRVGAVTLGNNEFKIANIANDFDYLIFIKESTNSKYLKKLN